MTFNKKLIGNIFYIVLFALLVYPKTRVYFLRMLSFSPSVEKVSERVKLSTYDWQLQGVNVPDLDFNEAIAYLKTQNEEYKIEMCEDLKVK